MRIHACHRAQRRVDDVSEFDAVTAVELGEWLGISDRSVRTHDERGSVVKVAPGRFDLKASIQRYCERLREEAAGRSGGEDGPNLMAEKAREARAKADMAEMKAAAMKGEYIPSSAVEAAWQGALVAFKGVLLAVPARARRVNARLTQEDADTFDMEIRAALTELSQKRLEYADPDEDDGIDDSEGVSSVDGNTAPASEDEAVGVGGTDDLSAV